MSFGWYPFRLDVPQPRALGLVGNADDLGSLIAPAAIAAIAVAVASPKYRIAALGVTTALIGGLVASQTLTAALGFLCGCAVLVIRSLRRSLRQNVAAGATLLIVTAFLVTTVGTVRHRLVGAVEHLRAGQFDEALSNRLTPVLAAWEMFRERPLTGIGPGGYAPYYYEAKIAAERRYGHLLGMDRLRPGFSRQASTINFGEAHNEFAEAAAETGLPGLLLMIAAIVAIGAARPAGADNDDVRARIADVAAAPLACALAVLAAGAFPLQLAASYVMLLYVCGVTLSWSVFART
jgi:O-antigen ligase